MMNPQKICHILLQKQWLSPEKADEALRVYQPLKNRIPFLQMLLQCGYINKQQGQFLHQITLNQDEQTRSLQQRATAHPTGREDLFQIPLRGNYQKYQILQELGRGGMGRVLLARDLDLKRLVAIKICHRVSPQDLLRFIQEAQIGSQLEHPNIGPIYDAGRTPEGNVFFAMKYIQGISLSKIVEELSKKNPSYQSKYSLRRSLTLFGKVLEGMAYVHSRGVIHRDLKPDNIMIGPFGEVLIVDWGVAKVLGEGGAEKKVQKPAYDSEILNQGMEGMTKAGAIVGTPGYMSPEQALGEKEKLSPGSDIYCLGVILYELLSLRRPFPGTEITKVLMAVIQGDFSPPRQTSPEQKIPPALESIVLKAMAQEPLNRYQSCQEMLDDVQSYLDDQAISVYSPPLSERMVRFIRKYAVLLAGAAFIFMVISLFSYFLAQAKEKQLREERKRCRPKKKRWPLRKPGQKLNRRGSRFFRKNSRPRKQPGWPLLRRIKRRERNWP